MTRLTQDDWLEAGLTILTHATVDSLTIDALCQHLKVTKGSFYHHFANRQHYLESLLSYWEDKFTAQFIAYSQQGQHPSEKIERLLQRIVDAPNNMPNGPEVAIRAWAMHDHLARTAQERVDRRRVEYVRDLFIALGHKPDDASIYAYMMYTILIGGEHIIPPLSAQQLRAIYGALEILFQQARHPQQTT